MRFVKVKDEERTGDVGINLDLVREVHFGGGLLHLYFKRSATSQDDVTFTGENARKIWGPWTNVDWECTEAGRIWCPKPIAAHRPWTR